METIATILQTFFDDLDIDPAAITEMEIIPGMPDTHHNYWIHVKPEQSWFACVSYGAGYGWYASSYDYMYDYI